MRQHCPTAEEDALAIDIENPLEILRRRILSALPLRQHTGIVDKNVYASELTECGFYHSCNRIGSSDVAAERHSLARAARLLNSRCNRAGTVEIAIGDQDVDAAFGPKTC